MTNDPATEASGLLRSAQLPAASLGLCLMIITLQREVEDLKTRLATLEQKRNSAALE